MLQSMGSQRVGHTLMTEQPTTKNRTGLEFCSMAIITYAQEFCTAPIILSSL